MYFLFLKNDIKTNAITNNTIDERVIIKLVLSVDILPGPIAKLLFFISCIPLLSWLGIWIDESCVISSLVKPKFNNSVLI